MPSRISQMVTEARPMPSRSMESSDAATRGSGRGRIISETTFVSINQGKVDNHPSSSSANDSGL